MLAANGPRMEEAPINETVIDPVAVVSTAATINGNKNPMYGRFEK
jgi:hypothetical protein